MARFLLFYLFIHGFFIASSQNNLPNTYTFNSRAASIYAENIYNDTIVCVGVAYRDNDTTSSQQGALIAFFDSCGNIIRYKKFFDAQGRNIFTNLSNKIVRTHDGSYFFVGSVGTNRMLFKTNMVGDSVFMMEYPPFLGLDNSNFVSVLSIKDCLYIIGYGYNNVPYEDDHFVIKVDFEGSVLDYWRIHTTENCEYFSDAVTSDNNIIIGIAQTNLCVSGIIESRTRLVEVDTLGNIQWDWVDTQNSPKYWGGFGIKHTPDGGWIYGGAYIDTFYSGVHFFQPFVTKLNSDLNHEWTHKIGYSDDQNLTIYDITIDPEGNYIAAGYYTIGKVDFPNPVPIQCAIVTKINSIGEIIWTNIAKAFQEDSVQTFIMYTQNVSLLSSGNIILGGNLFRIVNFEPRSEGWLAKLSPSGEVLDDPDPFCGFVSVQQPELEPVSNILCYPNPAGDFVQFDLSRLPSDLRCGQITIYDLMGKIIAEKHIEAITENIIVETRNVPDGIYLYRVACGQGHGQSGRFLVKKP